MMTSELFLMANEEIKGALLNREFERAEQLIEAWGQDVMRRMHNAAGENERRSIFESALAMGEEHMYLAHVVRSQIGSELQSNSASFLYADPDLEQPRWRMSA